VTTFNNVYETVIASHPRGGLGDPSTGQQPLGVQSRNVMVHHRS
jgi:hypothetical protein